MDENKNLAIGLLTTMAENVGWEDFPTASKYQKEILEIINLLKK